MRRTDCDDYKNPNRNLQIQLNTDGPIKYVEVLGGDMLSQSQSFGSCMSPMSEYSDFTLIKPSSTTDFKEVISVLDASLPDSTWTFESQQRLTDDGEPVQSATVTVSILLEDGLHEPILDLRQKMAEPSKKNGRITLYLILSLASCLSQSDFSS
ncbi:protocadherin gamma-C5-like protein [Lates japonicus]|uniref:Protocadherin gamma-C5-like protein n=1 Tax=Lates japonicus TaxID=270547 RepID=A0AAD3N8F0_LATJO|nr:protocadherin gamma-C5-like protein [Lates japonicus]